MKGIEHQQISMKFKFDCFELPSKARFSHHFSHKNKESLL